MSSFCFDCIFAYFKLWIGHSGWLECTREKYNVFRRSFDGLDDEIFPEYIKLAHVLSNQSLTLSDRVQRMVDLGLIHLGVRQDQQIYRRLLSAEDGADMLRFITNKLKEAKGYPDGTFEILVPDNFQRLVLEENQTRCQEALRRRDDAQRSLKISITFPVKEKFRNQGRGPNREKFIQVITDGGTLTQYSQDGFPGNKSVVYALFAQEQCVKRNTKTEKAAVKIALEGRKDALQH